jgi:hypothetical protein
MHPSSGIRTRAGARSTSSEPPGKVVNGRRRSFRGQGLVEFALALPVLMLLMLIVIDAGRLFYGYVAIHNAARIAANFAATHADSWPGPNPDQAEYTAQITRETSSLNCTDTINAPDFLPAGTPPRSVGDGHVATVTLVCQFNPMTPLITALVGNLNLTATDSFPIRSGLLAGFPIVNSVPTPTPTLAPSAPPSASAAPSASASGVPTPTPTLGPNECRVPDILNRHVNEVVADWSAAGFKANKLNVDIGQPDYLVRSEHQGTTFGTWDQTAQNCNSFTLNLSPLP